jgi:hypothetical protein
MTVETALRSISNYPITSSVISNIADEAGIDANGVANQEMRRSSGFLHAKALVYEYLAQAPNISQGGISYSFSQDERKVFSTKSSMLKKQAGIEEAAEIGYGYVGEDF